MSPNSTSPASGRSCHFGSSDETVYWSHEPFETFRHRVVDLCRTVLGQESPTLERLKGGSWNRVIGLLLPEGEYILRIPRYERGRMCYDVAPLQLLRQHPAIPAPTLITFDLSRENALGRSYMIQGWIPGQLLLYKYPGLPHRAKCAIARDLGRVYATMHGIRNSAAGRLMWKEDALRLEPLNPAQEEIPLSGDNGRAGESTVELILEVLRSKRERAIAADDERRLMTLEIEFLERLTRVAREMEQAGIWDTAYTYCLCHRDLEPRNILVGEQGITGILDWDGALFAPLVLSCRPPMWLWAWREDGPEDERLAGELPPTLEAQEVKRRFEEAAGPIYAQFAYHPGYRLARELIRWMVDGTTSTEDIREVDRFHEEWAALEGRLTPKGGTDVGSLNDA
jgi:aminoglycoside phosphotransferase (APT) family kinase protein